MAAKLFVVLACACVAVAQAALVKRETPTVLQDIEKHATEFRDTFATQLNALTSSKDSQEWQKALKDGSESVLVQIGSLSTSLQGALADASGKAKEALESSRASLERTAEELRKAHPDVEAHAGALKDKLQAAVQQTVQETQKLAKEVSANVEQTNQKLAPKLKAAYDDFVKQAQEVQKKLHDAADKQ